MSVPAPRRCGSLVLLACLLLATACAPSPTQLVVVVDTDLQVPAQLREVAVTVSAEGGVMESERALLTSAAVLPLTLGVSPTGDFLGPIDVVARGARDGTVVVERRARVTLVRGETRMLRLHLVASCVGVSCGAGESCGESGCEPIEIEELPPWPGSPPRLGDDAGVPDAGTRDAGPRDAAPTDATLPDGAAPCEDGAACDDGIFCNGFDRCAGGTCSMHAGDPCAAPTVCDEAMDSCRGCLTDADCPGDTAGEWDSCSYADGCAEAGTRARMVRSYACEDGACIASDRTETEPCARETDGESCGDTSCGSFGECQYPDACAETGEQARTCADRACAAGTCQTTMRTETMFCVRNTDGNTCAETSCGAYGTCDWAGTCDEDATRARTCTDHRCASGTCSPMSRSESQACTRDTDGTSCGTGSQCRTGACVSCTPTLSGTFGTVGMTFLTGVTASGSTLTFHDGSTSTTANITASGATFSGSFTSPICVWQVLGMGNRIRFVDWNTAETFDVTVSGASVSGSSTPPCVPSEFGCFPPCVARVVALGSTLRFEHTNGASGTLTFGCP